MKKIYACCAIIVWLILYGWAQHAAATDKTVVPAASTPSVSASASSGGDSRAYGVGSGSPSANACQRVVFFGFSVDVETCMLQQWASILGDNPSPVKLQVACQDSMLEALPMCVKYRKPAK